MDEGAALGGSSGGSGAGGCSGCGSSGGGLGRSWWRQESETVLVPVLPKVPQIGIVISGGGGGGMEKACI